jgi:hypothetical protein
MCTVRLPAAQSGGLVDSSPAAPDTNRTHLNRPNDELPNEYRLEILA